MAFPRPRIKRGRSRVIKSKRDLDELLSPVAQGSASKTPLIYILAASHSGSTLLSMLLAGHPDVCTVGELKATSLGDVNRYLCSCRTEIRTCAFWTSITKLMQLRGLDFDITDARTHFSSVPSLYARRLLSPLHRGPLLEWLRDGALALSRTWRSQLPRMQARNAALAACVCAYTGKGVIVDSSKIGVRLKYLLRNPDLDVRVIRLIRDGRAVALTYTDPARFADAADPALRGGGTGGDRDRERLPLRLAAREWRRSNEEAETILGRLNPLRWVEVRYESLCTNPASTLRQLFAFMGLDPHPIDLSTNSRQLHLIGNGMRLDSSPEVRLDARWNAVLDTRALKLFDSVAGALNRRLGYQ
jgi:Sulfotransferase family